MPFGLMPFVRIVFSAVAAAMSIALAPAQAAAQGHPELEASAKAALTRLKAQVPLADTLEKRAVAVLVFPEVTKAGFLIGGEYGNGIMVRRGRFGGHYNVGNLDQGRLCVRLRPAGVDGGHGPRGHQDHQAPAVAAETALV